MIQKRKHFTAFPIAVGGTPRISSVLIANRGEIACRVIASCRKLGIVSIAVYCDVDAESPFVKLADKAHLLGPAEEQPYQNIAKLIDIARTSGADAIHPGYGYLSENASFAEAVNAAGIIFVGPSPESIAALGDKREAKVFLAANSTVPLIPGYDGLDQDPTFLAHQADQIGYPIMIKASAGGGGKGMRIVHDKKDFHEALERCTSEAARLFGSAHCLIEKYIQAGKHVEIQIFGDGDKAVSFLDRECSVQRRNQKVIEESPCPWLSPALRQEMSSAGLEIAKLLKYKSAGTVEFIVDIKTGRFYFLEVNTRIQVEHPITEEVVGIDLIALQLFVASGGKFSSLPELRNITQTGHSIEVRLCAEDPFNDFRPCIGTINLFKTMMDTLAIHDADVRYELGIETGSTVTIHFDSMISKIIVWAPDRDIAIRKMLHVLKHTVCLGLTTNQIFLQRILESPLFHNLDYTTALIPQNSDNLLAPVDNSRVLNAGIMSAAIISQLTRIATLNGGKTSFRTIPGAFRNQHKDRHISTTRAVTCDLSLLGDDRVATALVTDLKNGDYRVLGVDDETTISAEEKKEFFNAEGGPLVKRYYSALRSDQGTVLRDVRVLQSTLQSHVGYTTGEVTLSTSGQLCKINFAVMQQNDFKEQVFYQETGSGVPLSYTISSILAWAGKLDEKASDAQKSSERAPVCPMPSKILQVLVKDGAKVKTGDGLLVLESMKTEIRVTSSVDGVVRMRVKEGEVHPEGTVLCEILDEDE